MGNEHPFDFDANPDMVLAAIRQSDRIAITYFEGYLREKFLRLIYRELRGFNMDTAFTMDIFNCAFHSLTRRIQKGFIFPLFSNKTTKIKLILGFFYKTAKNCRQTLYKKTGNLSDRVSFEDIRPSPSVGSIREIFSFEELVRVIIGEMDTVCQTLLKKRYGSCFAEKQVWACVRRGMEDFFKTPTHAKAQFNKCLQALYGAVGEVDDELIYQEYEIFSEAAMSKLSKKCREMLSDMGRETSSSKRHNNDVNKINCKKLLYDHITTLVLKKNTR